MIDLVDRIAISQQLVGQGTQSGSAGRHRAGIPPAPTHPRIPAPSDLPIAAPVFDKIHHQTAGLQAAFIRDRMGRGKTTVHPFYLRKDNPHRHPIWQSPGPCRQLGTHAKAPWHMLMGGLGRPPANTVFQTHRSRIKRAACLPAPR